MTNEKKPTRAEAATAKAEADERNAAADAADVAARPMNYNSAAESDPNSEASKQRDSLAELTEMASRMKGWYHDASHSADAERLAQQRARDEAAGMTPPAADK